MALVSTVAAANGFNAAVRDRWLDREFMSLFTQRSPLFMMLALRGNIQKKGFGIEMREPLRTPVPNGPQLAPISNPYATVNLQPMVGFTSAVYALAGYQIPVSWPNKQMKQAGSPVEMVNWVQAQFEQAIDLSMDRIMYDFWKDPADTNSGGTDAQLASILTYINGGYNSGGQAPTDGGYLYKPLQAQQSMPAVVQSSGGSAQTTVGTIQRSAVGAGYWCPSVRGSGAQSGNPASSYYTDPGAQAFTGQVMNSIYEDAFQTGKEPDMAIAPPDIFSKAIYFLTTGGTNGGQIYGESKLAKWGFSSIRYRNAEITVDQRCPISGYLGGTSTAVGLQMLMLNSRYLKIRADGRKPSFRKVEVLEPVQAHVGEWWLQFTSEHLGNVHSRHCNLTV